MRLHSLEWVRAFAALLVVFFHTQAVFSSHLGYTPFGDAFHSGDKGVDLFFVLSGFIITYVHRKDIGQPKRAPGYVFNRLTRIYPSVWIISLFAIFVYFIGFGGAAKSVKLGYSALAASIMLFPQHIDPLVNVTWTLCFEMFFYVVFLIAILNRYIGIAIFLT